MGARNAGAGHAAAEAIAKSGGRATFLKIDVADDANITAAAREFSKGVNYLDVLVNNAGIITDGDHAILEVSDELLRKTLETNTLGALRVTRAFAPLLAKSKAPRVINVSSGGGQLTGGADGWAPAYCISKTALNGVTSQLAAALPKAAVNSVCPGCVRTDLGGRNATRSVEEGANTIVWLATDAPQNLTGKFLRTISDLDGGDMSPLSKAQTCPRTPNHSTSFHLLWSLSMISRRRRMGGMPWLSSSLWNFCNENSSPCCAL